MPLPFLMVAAMACKAGTAAKVASAAASAKCAGAAAGSSSKGSAADRLFHTADAVHEVSELSSDHDRKRR